MNFDSGTAYAESDADDEYERSLHSRSPVGQDDDEISPSDSEGRSSTEHTPTTYGPRHSVDRLPETIISEWTADECADFIAAIGLEQYSEQFVENEIVGEALIALLHDDLKSMGIPSVGHRLTILKSVYEVKKAQDIPMESDHYMPASAESEAQTTNATLKDIKNLVEQLRLRDERMSLMEQDLRRVTEELRRMRDEVQPALRMAKPLPNVSSSGYGYDSATTPTISPPAITPSSQTSSGGTLKRQYSTKKIVLGNPPKNSSPTHLQTSHEQSLMERTLDPTNAAERAVASSSHLAAMSGATSPGYSPNIPSPTSPPTLGSGTLPSRPYRSDQPTPSTRTTFNENDHLYNSKQANAPRRMQTPAPDTPGASSASVEIFKSFRVSMDDPCYKVLPAALRKYQINAPPEQYALYIVYGDQERCLGLDEKPLILFKQLDKEGKKPMFMLRKTNMASSENEAPGSAGLNPSRGLAYDPPGGII